MAWDAMLPDEVAQQMFEVAKSRNPELDSAPVPVLQFTGRIVRLDWEGHWGFDKAAGGDGFVIFDPKDVGGEPLHEGYTLDRGPVGQQAYAEELGGLSEPITPPEV